MASFCTCSSSIRFLDRGYMKRRTRYTSKNSTAGIMTEKLYMLRRAVALRPSVFSSLPL